MQILLRKWRTLLVIPMQRLVFASANWTILLFFFLYTNHQITLHMKIPVTLICIYLLQTEAVFVPKECLSILANLRLLPKLILFFSFSPNSQHICIFILYVLLQWHVTEAGKVSGYVLLYPDCYWHPSQLKHHVSSHLSKSIFL